MKFKNAHTIMTKLTFALLVSLAAALSTISLCATPAVGCRYNPPALSPSWIIFNKNMQEKYRVSELSDRNRALVYGYAFGQYLKENSGRTPSHTLCIEKALKAEVNIGIMLGTSTTDYRRLTYEARIGKHNAEIARIIGIDSNYPESK